ncbi:MAG: hypothetical protein HY675_18635 [Chloroflexi bacterium]|nr:hypothetical protein [Chloroflexota bacterium]
MGGNKSSAYNLGLSMLVVVAVLSLVVACAPAATAPTATPTKAPAPAPPAAPTKAPAAAPTPAPTKPAAPAPTPAAKASSGADFYKGKTVTLIVTYGAGGGTDAAARIIANFWKDFVEGTLIVRNRAGAGGLEGMNAIYEARPDGLTLGFSITGSMASAQIFEEAGVNYDIGKVTWIGDFGKEPIGLAIAERLPYKSMDELRKVEGLKFGGLGVRAAGGQGGGLAIELFGLNDGRVVAGYASTAEIQLAMGRGEVDGYTYSASTLQDGINKKINKAPFVTLDSKRSDAFPDTPAVPELLKLSPEQERLLTIFVSTQNQSKALLGPPGIPEDRVLFLRQTFNKMMETKALVDELKKRYPVWTGYMKGEDVTAGVREVMTMPKDAKVKYDEAIMRHIK